MINSVYIDDQNHIQIELLNTITCKVKILDPLGPKQLEGIKGINRLLTACLRRSGLDGKTPLQFKNELIEGDKYILIIGVSNLFDGIHALNNLNLISNDLQNAIINQNISDVMQTMIKQAQVIVSTEGQISLMNTIQAAVNRIFPQPVPIETTSSLLKK